MSTNKIECYSTAIIAIGKWYQYNKTPEKTEIINRISMEIIILNMSMVAVKNIMVLQVNI